MNIRQLEVLKWIVAGCPEGVMTGSTHKTTSIALQNRRLAKVSKRKGVWKAEATDAGRYFLEHGQYPAGHWSGSAEPASGPATPAAAPLRSKPKAKPKRERKVTGLRPVDQMMADLAVAGGRMTVAADTGTYWENLVSSATRFNKVPEGKLLKIARGNSWSERTIWLEDPPGWMPLELVPIPVAEALRNPHPAVKALRDGKDRLPMKREVRARALRILDAIAKTATARGYTVKASKPEPGYRYAKGHLMVMVGRHSNTLIIDELNDRVSHEPTQQELRDKKRYSWTRIPTHDQVPSGRLRIKFDRGWHVRQDSFSDTKIVNLEDRLPQLLQELELRAAEEEERELARERERQERKRRWERVRDEAIVRARELHRAQVLAAQVDRWHEVQRLDAYLEAMDARVAGLEPESRQTAQEWLGWARQYRQLVDPLGQPLHLPPDPEFKANVIAPFMQGLSPYGPSG